MAAPYGGTLILALSNNWVVRGAASNDLLLFTKNSNQSMIFGCSNNSNAALVISSNSRVGIGLSNPGFALDVAGDLNFSGTLRQGGVAYVGSQWSNNSSNIFLMGSNVGLYTQTPSEALDIRGSNAKVGCNLYVMSNIGVGKSNPGYSIDTTGDINFGGILRQNGVAYVGSQWSNNSSNIFLMGSNVGLYTQTPSEALDIRGSNAKVGCNLYVMSNVGVGTSNPAAALHVASNLRVDGNMQIYSSVQFTGVEFLPGLVQNNYTQLIAATSNIQGYSNLVYGASGSNGTMLSIMSNTSNDSWRFVSGASSNEVYRITGTGWHGIGTSNPMATLHVSGSTLFGHNNVYNTASAGWYNIGLWDASSNANNGAKLVLRIIGSSLYTGGSSNASQSGGETRICLNNLNNSVGTSVNVDGSWSHLGGTINFSSVKVVQNGVNRSQYYIYANVNTYTQHAIIPETTLGSTFTPQFTSTTDPGANSSTVQLLRQTPFNVGNIGVNTTASMQHALLVYQPSDVAVAFNINGPTGAALQFITSNATDGNTNNFGNTTALLRITKDSVNNRSIHAMGMISTAETLSASNVSVTDQITAGGFLAIGGSGQTGNHALLINQKAAPVGINVSNGNGTTGFQVNCANGISGTARSDAIVCVGSTGGRSITALGSINAANGDFAEYVYKARIEDVFEKGEIIGIDADGKLTKIYSESVSFGIKSTDPGYVGSDDWCTLGPCPLDDDQRKNWQHDLLALRNTVEEIAFCGRVPVNVLGAYPGDYIIAEQGQNDTIVGKIVASKHLQVYDIPDIVGRVWNIMDDGRAMVKVVQF